MPSNAVYVRNVPTISGNLWKIGGVFQTVRARHRHGRRGRAVLQGPCVARGAPPRLHQRATERKGLGMLAASCGPFVTPMSF